MQPTSTSPARLPDGNFTVQNLNTLSVLRVYDLAGRTVAEQLLLPRAPQVSLMQLEAGVYWLTIYSDTGMYRQQVVIQR